MSLCRGFLLAVPLLAFGAGVPCAAPAPPAGGSARFDPDPSIAFLTYSPRGDEIATWSATGGVVLWDASGVAVRRLPLVGRCDALAFSPDGRTLATAERDSLDSPIVLWDVASGRELRRLRGQMDIVLSATFSPDGRTLAASTRGALLEWDSATGKKLRRYYDRKLEMRWVSYLADGRVLLTGDYELQAWNPRTDGFRLIRTSVGGEMCPGAGRLKRRLRGVCVSPDGGRVYTTVDFTARRIGIFDTATGAQFSPPDDDAHYISSFALSPDGRTLALGDAEGAARLYETETGRLRAQVRLHAQEVCPLAFSPDGKQLVSGDESGGLIIRPTGTGNLSRSIAPSAARLESFWADLAGDDAACAYHAIEEFALFPRAALPFLRARLAPADASCVAGLIAALDADDFARREEASAGLGRLGRFAAPALREALAGRPSAEVRRRAEDLLAHLGTAREWRRTLRALEAIERMATVEAQQALEVLARGDPRTRLTSEARLAADRLSRAAR